MNTVSVVITSYNRFDLLKITVESFMKLNKYPIDKFIVIEDSADIRLKSPISNLLSTINNSEFIFNEKNITQVASIDKAYNNVNSDYIFHSEDDYTYSGNPNFIQNSIDILEERKDIHLIQCRHEESYKPSHGDYFGKVLCPNTEITKSGIKYRKVNLPGPADSNWCGFTFNPGLRRLSDYKSMFPNGYLPFVISGNTGSHAECDVNKEAMRQGFQAAHLIDTCCSDLGRNRSTYK